MIRIAHINKTVYGVVTDSNTFVKTKWREVNPCCEPSRICAQEFQTEHEVNDQFWSTFSEITADEWNDLWAKDMNSVQYVECPKKKKCQ